MTSLRLLSYNVKMLPAVARWLSPPLLRPRGWWEAESPDLRRCLRIAQRLVAEGPDIICLQEVFAKRAELQLSKTLREGGYHVAPVPGGWRSPDWRWGGEDWGWLRPGSSGLLIASRRPFEELAFERYECAARDDALAAKGFVGFRLPLGQRSLRIVNTHLQAHRPYAEVRGRQLEQLRRWLEGQRSATSTLVLGDLNTIAETAGVPTGEYKRMRSIFGSARDLFRQHHPDALHNPGFTWDGMQNRMTGDALQERLDYAFSFGDAEAVRCNSAKVLPLDHKGRHLSDHFAVDLRIEVR